jgi:hypothetical protein
MFARVENGLFQTGTVVSVFENANCWTIVTQEGLVEEPNLELIVTLNQAYTYQQTYIDCPTCLNEQTIIILSEPQTGTNPYDPTANVGGGVTRDLYITEQNGEIIVIDRTNNL